jgi:mono/diheme cytochrome c family protein
MSEPYFKHDCAKCHYLGSMHMDQPYDWYVCGDKDSGSVIARYGNEGREYWSHMPSMVLNDRHLYTKHGDKLVVNGMVVLARHMLSLRSDAEQAG